MPELLTMRNVSKSYAGVFALKQIDFSLAEGERHCLAGQNGSGKSTLIKVLSGVVKPEIGAEIQFNQQRFTHFEPNEAMDLGVRVIYQDLSLFPNLTVKENICFRMHSESGSPFVNWRNIEQQAQMAMETLNLSLDLNRMAGSLSIAQQQLVEITRSLLGELRLLILDEPTASLTRKEVNALFAALERLKERGVATLFVSHKLNEVFEITDRVTVLRDGSKVGEYASSELDQKKLTFLMTGQSVKVEPPTPLASTPEKLLEVRGLSKAGNFKDVSFDLHKGEILGITGLLGSGRTELALSIFGMNPQDSGDLVLEGKSIQIHSNRDAKNLGIGLVPENRLTQGLVQAQSILDNVSLTVLDKFLDKTSLLDRTKQSDNADNWVKDLRIKISDKDAPVRTLSGGNQQKIVLAKWLATHPKVLILDEPTIGIDVLAKNGVHELIKELARNGMGILMISDEIHEVLANCHRVLVMQHGRIVHELIPDEQSENELLDKFNLS